MQYYALYRPEEAEPFPKDIVDRPEIAKYYTNWGRYGDMALVAEDTATGALIGAIWGRLFSPEQAGYGFVDPHTPEIDIALKPEFRGQGIGSRLLQTFIAQAREKSIKALSLSVDRRNPALKLYKNLGFEEIGSEGNPILLLRL